MLRVLLVEDSKLDEKIISAQLRAGNLKFELQRVESREPFVTALVSWHPDIVLADYKVPGFGGEEALRLAREHRPELPFVFVSGALGEHAAVELLKRGATDYILKDRLERLVPSVERALREAREKLERIAAQRQVMERERTLSTLMSNLPGMAFRARIQRPWFLEFASEGCLALTGYEPSAFTSKGGIEFDAIMHPDDVERVAAETAAAFGAHQQLMTTYRIRTREGEERHVWVRAVPVVAEDDGGPVMEGFVTDITRQKLAEAEVQRRIEFEQQLIGIVSHDLKNPLHAIRLGALLLAERGTHDEAVARLTKRILSSTDRATRLINELLDFTQVRLGTGLPVTPVECSLRELTVQVMDEFEQSHPQRRIRMTSSADTTACVDPGRYSQALTNLLQNALTYSPKDTPISITLDVDARTVALSVHNEGDPIPPAQLADVFEPLRRGVAGTTSSLRSIGLGLFIVASIARAHDGSVSVTSTREDGTTFVMRFPRTPPKGQQAHEVAV